MPETNTLESIINKNGDPNHSIEKLAFYLDSNKTYKYTQTYLTDSKSEYSLFKENFGEFKSVISSMYIQYEHYLKILRITLLRYCINIGLSDQIKKDFIKFNYEYKLKLNNAVFISSQKPELLQIEDENKLLSFISQKSIYNHCLTLEFYYKIQTAYDIFLLNTDPSKRKNEDLYKIEHTFYIKNVDDLKLSLNTFLNLLRIDLCAKVYMIK